MPRLHFKRQARLHLRVFRITLGEVVIMEKQLSGARVRRYAEYNGLQSSATSDNVCFPRTLGIACLYGLGNAAYVHAYTHAYSSTVIV
jgi:hypothetical protein